MTIDEISTLPGDIAARIEEWPILERNIKFRAYALLPATEAGMHLAIDKVLKENRRPDLRFAVNMIVKELAMNAVKANLKFAYFSDLNIDLLDTDRYEEGIRDFHDLLNEEWAVHYALKTRAQNMFADIWFMCDKEYLTVRVLNNRPMSPVELERFRDKIALAQQSDVAQEYAESGGDTQEGAGMGLILVVNIFRSLNMPLNSLKMDLQNKDVTAVEVRFPLKERKD